MFNLIRYIKPMRILKYHYTPSTPKHMLNLSESYKFVQQIKKQKWAPNIKQFISRNNNPSAISQKLIDSLDTNPLKSSQSRDFIIDLIKKDFKFLKPFCQLKDDLKIMRILLRLDFPKELLKVLENYMVEIDDESLSLPSLLLYESICQLQIKFSIGKDEILYDRLLNLKEEDFAIVKQFLAIADVAESYFPAKIVAILCKEAAQNIEKFDCEELLEVFNVVSKVKSPNNSFLVDSIIPFLDKALIRILKQKNIQMICHVIDSTKKLKLNFTPLIEEINKNPEMYWELIKNFNYRQAVDSIFRRANVAIPQNFADETRSLLIEYFEKTDLENVAPLEYFMRNINTLDQKHRPLLSRWFDRAVEQKTSTANLIKILKLGSEFGSKASLTKLLNIIINLKGHNNFQLILNATWVDKIHKLNKMNNQILQYVPGIKVAPEDYMRLINIICEMEHSAEKDNYIIKLESSTRDILKRSIFSNQIYIKMLNMYHNQVTFKDNKMMYMHIQHSIIERWSKELPNAKQVERYFQVVNNIKGGTKQFKVILDMLRDNKIEKAKDKIERYRKDVEQNKFNEGSEWWN